MNEGGMLKPALIGGVLLGILSVIPGINCLCCAWVIGGGILAANLYVKACTEAVTLGRGLGLGLLTGVIGALVYTLFSIPLQLLMSGMGVNLLEQVEQILSQVPEVTPEAREQLRTILSNPGAAGIFFFLVGGVFTLFIFSLMGMVGGAIGVAIFEKRKPGQAGPGTPSYQPPSDSTPPPLPPQAM